MSGGPHVALEESRLRETISTKQSGQPFEVQNRHGPAIELKKPLIAELSKRATHRLPATTDEVGHFLVGQLHLESNTLLLSNPLGFAQLYK